MHNPLYIIEKNHLDTITSSIENTAMDALEQGQVIFFPNLSFGIEPQEQCLFSEKILAPKEKNISYQYKNQRLAGLHPKEQAIQKTTKEFMHRFSVYAKAVIDTCLPHYQHALQWGRTSYRPAEIEGRKTSKRKDDTRLHVDSFSATPVNGLRILRVFCNVHPHGKARVWHVGEPFEQVLAQFAATIPNYKPWLAKLLLWTKTTKTLRSAYDHYMLHLHDHMKLDDTYQKNAQKQRIDFPSQSTWIVFTDHVSHSAQSGQFLLEQTFYLPVEAMKYPEHSPLQQWGSLRTQNI